MAVKEIQKEIMALDGSYSISIDLSIPLGDNIIAPVENEFFDGIIINQVTRGLEKAIDSYKKSPLPDRFIDGQRYIITNNLPLGVLGSYDIRTDNILLDADVISDVTDYQPAFLLGHEVGHKILRYRKIDYTLRDIANILGVSLYGNENELAEFFCDECGNIAAGIGYDRELLRGEIDPNRRAYIHKKILYNLYK